MPTEEFYCYEFGEFRLDARRRTLTRGGQLVPVSARNFDLLSYMVEHGGRIIEHDELLDKVWAGTFVEQATLKKGISALRQILTETPETEFIRTIPRRGYSFVWPVRKAPENGEVLFVRVTEQEITVEEFEETDDPADGVSSLTANNAASRALLGDTRTSTPWARRWPRRVVLIGIGAVAIVLGVIGLRYYFSRPASPRFSAENIRLTRLTNHGRVLSAATISPDGGYVLYPTSETDGEVLWLRQVSANSENKLTVPAKGFFWGFEFAPDNSFVYYIFKSAADNTKSGLFKIPFLGGEPQRLLEDVSGVSVSPDGKQLSVVRITDITTVFTVDANGENPHTVATFPANYRLWSQTWTPDGGSVLCTARKTEGDKMLFYVSEISAAAGRETVVVPPQERVLYSAIWLPDRSGLLLEVREPNADLRQIWHYTPTAQSWRRVTNDNDSYQHFKLSRDGSTIVALRTSRLASVWTAESTWSKIKADSFRPLNNAVGMFDRVDWFADGKLMYTGVEDQQESVFSINGDGTNARALTADGNGIWLDASVGGNGQNVELLSTRSGTRQVWRIDEDGKNLTRMSDSPTPVVSARLLRDNATVVYLADQAGKINLLWRTRDGQTKPVTDSDTDEWAISPDESLLAANTRDQASGTYRVEVRSLVNGQVVKTLPPQPLSRMIFTPDGKDLAYAVGTAGGGGQIVIVPLDGSEAFTLTEFPSESIFSFAWSRDGKRLAVVRGRQMNDVVMIKVVAQ